MPHVSISARESSDYLFRELKELLPNIIAQHLACRESGGDLTPEDISMRFEVLSGKFDTQKEDLVITITANWFPSRYANKDRAVEAIISDLIEQSSLEEGSTVGVWLLLPHSEWQEVTVYID